MLQHTIFTRLFLNCAFISLFLCLFPSVHCYFFCFFILWGLILFWLSFLWLLSLMYYRDFLPLNCLYYSLLFCDYSMRYGLTWFALT